MGPSRLRCSVLWCRSARCDPAVLHTQPTCCWTGCMLSSGVMELHILRFTKREPKAVQLKVQRRGKRPPAHQVWSWRLSVLSGTPFAPQGQALQLGAETWEGTGSSLQARCLHVDALAEKEQSLWGGKAELNPEELTGVSICPVLPADVSLGLEGRSGSSRPCCSPALTISTDTAWARGRSCCGQMTPMLRDIHQRSCFGSGVHSLLSSRVILHSWRDLDRSRYGRTCLARGGWGLQHQRQIPSHLAPVPRLGLPRDTSSLCQGNQVLVPADQGLCPFPLPTCARTCCTLTLAMVFAAKGPVSSAALPRDGSATSPPHSSCPSAILAGLWPCPARCL